MWQSCQTDSQLAPESQKAPLSATLDSLSLHILIFKDESIMELWGADKGKEKKRLSNFKLENTFHWPLGIFKMNLTDKESIHFIFPNEFYREKAHLNISNYTPYFYKLEPALSKSDLKLLKGYLIDSNEAMVLICPNDIRLKNKFNPQINGPIWLPELYSLLELHLKDYPTEKLTY